MNNKLKLVIGVLLFILSSAAIATSSYFLSTYNSLETIAKSFDLWEYYGFVVLLIISISIFIISSILIVEITYIKFVNKKIKQGEKNG